MPLSKADPVVPHMPKVLRPLVAIAPFSVISLLVWVMIDSIELLNPSLEYVGPRGELPEDIYGFGFAGVWNALLLPFACLCLLSRFGAGQKQCKYWVVLLGSFAICSIGGFCLDHIIWPQIIR
jgi:hypothetical protein